MTRYDWVRAESSDRIEWQSKLTAAESTIRSHEQSSAAQRETIASLERTVSELPSKSDYAKLKEKVKVLHEMELIDDLDDDNKSNSINPSNANTAASTATTAAVSAATAASSASPARSSSEVVLTRKLRKLETDCTNLKIELSDRTTDLQTAQTKLTTAESLLNEYKSLVLKLEDDLAQSMIANATNGTSFMKVRERTK